MRPALQLNDARRLSFRGLSKHVIRRAPNVIAAALGLYAIGFTYVSMCQCTHERRLGEVERLLTIGLLDAESGQRAYLLTGDKAFLEQYKAGLKSISIYSPVYERILVDVESKAISAEVMQLLEFKQAEMFSTITAHDRNDDRAAINIVASQVGHAYTERIYSDMHRIRALEAQHLAPFQFWKAAGGMNIHDADRALSPSALLLKMQAGL